MGLPDSDWLGRGAQAEALFQQFKAKKDVLVGKNKESVVAAYGSAAQPADEAALLLGQTEAYVEYDARGRLLRGDAAAARSRYEEDAHPSNHTSVRPAVAGLGGSSLGAEEFWGARARASCRSAICFAGLRWLCWVPKATTIGATASHTPCLACRCGAAGGRTGGGATHAATKRCATATARVRRARRRPRRLRCRWLQTSRPARGRPSGQPRARLLLRRCAAPPAKCLHAACWSRSVPGEAQSPAARPANPGLSALRRCLQP